MKDRIFRIVLSILLGACLLLTAAHFAYAVYAYQHSSIVTFIGRERW